MELVGQLVELKIPQDKQIILERVVAQRLYLQVEVSLPQELLMLKHIMEALLQKSVI